MTNEPSSLSHNRILRFISNTLYCLWTFLPGVLTIVLSFFLFIKLSMGQDIIVQVAEDPAPLICSILAIFFWAYAIWYSARIISYRKGRDGSGSMRDLFLLHFPRIMCFNAFMSIQGAILCLPTVFLSAFNRTLEMGQHLTYMRVWLWGMVIVNNVLYIFMYQTICGKSRHKKLFGLLAAIIVLANLVLWAVVFYRATRLGAPTHVHWLAILAAVLFLIQVVLMRLLMKRENWVGTKEHRDAQKNDNQLRIGSHVIANTGSVDETNSYKVFNAIFVVGLSMYFSSIFFIGVANLLGALATALTAFGFLTGAANLITYFSTRLRINLFFIWLIVLLISGSMYDPYKVRVTENKTSASVYASRPDVCTYVRNWMNDPVRSGLINAADSAHKFDVYIVLADGGASRSGYWVASVLSALEDATKANDTTRFSNHLLCLSSASGGSVGNASFYSMLSNRGSDDSNYLYRARKFLGTDFLSYLLSHYLGPDIWGHYTLFCDRAAALESVMDAAADSLYKGGFSKTVDQYLAPSGRLPILFINTTEVQHGMPGVVSSVKLEGFSKRYDVLHTLDTITNDEWKGKNIRLSTAAVLSSRFPYISPAGKLGAYYYVDGGYFDNSGAGIVNEMMIMLDDTLGADPRYRNLRFHLMHITNGMDTSTADKQINALVNNLAAPVITVLSTYGSQTDVNNDRLNLYFRSRDTGRYVVEEEINLYRHHETEEYPMNWVISRYNLLRMNQRVHDIIDTFRLERKYGLK